MVFQDNTVLIPTLVKCMKNRSLITPGVEIRDLCPDESLNSSVWEILLQLKQANTRNVRFSKFARAVDFKLIIN